MATLSGTTPAATYPALIKFNDNSAISATKRILSDGAGGASPLYLSASQLNIGGSAIGTAVFGTKGTGTTSATFSFRAENSAATSAMTFGDDGLLYMAVPGGNTTLSGLQLVTYYVRSTNGAAFINIDGGNMQLYNGAGALGLNLVTASSRLIQPTTIGSNTAPVASAMLEVISTTQGILPPRMTTTQKNAIATPAAGLMVYDTTTNKLCCYNGTIWNDLF